MPKKKKTRKPSSSPVQQNVAKSQYGWLQKTVVFVIAGVLVGTVIVAAGLGNGVETLPGAPEPTLLPTEIPFGEITITPEPTA